MAIPRILLVIPGIAAGLLLPALTAAPKSLPAHDVGMIQMNFAVSKVTIKSGQRLTFFNDSHVVHIVGPGHNGHIYAREAGVPFRGFHLMQTNVSFTTPPWTAPGRYQITCSVHPMMNLTVVVTR